MRFFIFGWSIPLTHCVECR